MFRLQAVVLITLCAGIAGCGDDNAADDTRTPTAVDARGSWDDVRLTREQIESGRYDTSWRDVVEIDTVARTGSVANPEGWEDISFESVNNSPMHLPLHGEVAGPSVLRVQVLLDRAFFSPGVTDGRWGKNTEKAIYWLQRREGLPATGRVDEATFERLRRLGGDPHQLVREHTLTAEEVEGPFIEIPEDIYAKAELDCMCYESLREKLGELFHTTSEVLEQLNPGVELTGLTAGSTLFVPNVGDGAAAPATRPARLVISDRGSYLHALDANGEIIYHFPSTLGSTYNPSPEGELVVVSIAEDPWWHYQPEILEGEDPDDPDARIPPGPNNAVGVVWMELSKENYGIHGTSAPATIGYATSSGCIRLTNWDALFLSRQIADGIEVQFRDT